MIGMNSCVIKGSKSSQEGNLREPVIDMGPTSA